MINRQLRGEALPMFYGLNELCLLLNDDGIESDRYNIVELALVDWWRRLSDSQIGVMMKLSILRYHPSKLRFGIRNGSQGPFVYGVAFSRPGVLSRVDVAMPGMLTRTPIDGVEGQPMPPRFDTGLILNERQEWWRLYISTKHVTDHEFYKKTIGAVLAGWDLPLLWGALCGVFQEEHESDGSHVERERRKCI